MIEVREYGAGELVAWHHDEGGALGFGDSLIILGSGEVEVAYNTGGATAALNLRNPGEPIAVETKT